MSAGDNLSPHQFRHEYEKQSSPGMVPEHRINAYAEDLHVGQLSWYTDSGEIKHIAVDPNYRRQGVASGMFAAARAVADLKRMVKEPKHSSTRTASGDSWAKSVTPEEMLPPRPPKKGA